MESNTPPPSSPSPWRSCALIGLVTGLICLPLCWRLAHQKEGSDHGPHLQFAIDLAETGKPLPHPLLHYTLLVLSPSDDYETLAHTASILYAVCIGLSAMFTARILIQAAPQTGPALVGWLTLGLSLAMALPNWWNFSQIYLLQVNPNCWHNPTAIFCMPFVLALYWLFMREMEQMTRTSTLWIGALIAVTAFAKPNYILAFAPIYALHLAAYAYRQPGSWQQRFGTFCLLELKAFGLLLPALWLQYQLLQTMSQEKDVIVIEPFLVWKHFVPPNVIPFALLVGLVFPLAVFICYLRESFQYLPLQRAWLVFDVALLQFILFSQKKNFSHANFYWGVLFADRVLFILSTAFLLQQPASKRKAFCFFCLILHFLSGLYYTGKCWVMFENIYVH